VTVFPQTLLRIQKLSSADRLLEHIEEGIVKHGGDLGGWTRRYDDALQLFDGRITVRAELNEQEQSREGTVHAHVFATLHEYDDEVLDACLFGAGKDDNAAVAEAAVLWITCVAGPIKSFLDGKPVCMTCQAGVQDGDASKGFFAGDYGLPGLRAFVGPSISRGKISHQIQSTLDDTKPWFRFAAESAAPRRVHLAKATIVSSGKDGWYRELEIDGHDVSHHDPNWPAGISGPDFGYLTRFAVFEFPRNSSVISRRAELERTIRHFAEHFSEYESTDQLMEEMVRQGFDADLVHEAESIGTIAFGRMYFEPYQVQYASTIIRARRDKRIETDIPLMSLPAYSRARALVPQLREKLSKDDFQMLCLYNAESHVILNAIEAGGEKADLTGMMLFPCVVPDRGVSDETMNAAMAMLHDLANRKRRQLKKPWWKFW
jgi:hypothetical protein